MMDSLVIYNLILVQPMSPLVVGVECCGDCFHQQRLRSWSELRSKWKEPNVGQLKESLFQSAKDSVCQNYTVVHCSAGVSNLI